MTARDPFAISESADEPPAPSDARWWRRRERWSGALREFATVVLGVLVALAGQAWWQNRADDARQDSYLRQLLADTRENARRIDGAIEDDSTRERASARLARAMQDSVALPPADSLANWVLASAGASDLRVLSGTYTALVGTGDLRLVRNDSLRALLTRYDASLEAESARLQQLRGAVIDQAGPFGRAFPFMRGIFVERPHPTAAQLARLRGNDDAAAVLFALQAGNTNRLSGLRALRRETLQLRTALEHAVAER